MQSLVGKLDKLRQLGAYRSLTLNRDLVNLSSNDYLGLSNHPDVRRALVAALEQGIPLGATGSRLLSGNLELHEDVEKFLARTFHSESALLFSSGYLANVAILSAFGEETEFFSDELNHASFIDGMRLAKAKRTKFRHNDPEDLRQLLSVSRSSRKVIVTESVFSMDGDRAPLSEFVNLANEFETLLVVDEAHATGTFGKMGLGCLEGMKLPVERVISIHTCGKALGSQGAFVLTTKEMREYIINLARPFIFSTAVSPLIATQIKAAVGLLSVMEGERKHLRELSQLLRKEIRPKFDIGKSESQIIPIILGSNERAFRASRFLQERGLDVRAIRSPTVPKGRERLRISLTSSLTVEDIQILVEVLGEMKRYE